MDDQFSASGQDPGSSMTKPARIDTVKPRLLDQVRDTVRRKHYSIRTEQSYIDWIKRYIYFHNRQHPCDLKDVSTTMIYTHVLNKGGRGVQSPSDRLFN